MFVIFSKILYSAAYKLNKEVYFVYESKAFDFGTVHCDTKTEDAKNEIDFKEDVFV